MLPKEGLDLRYFLAAFRRRLWYVVLPFFLVSIVSVIYCIKAPKIYESKTLILIQPQEVPTDYVKPTVTTDVKARLNSITEQVLSRSKLEDIINKFDLYSATRAKASMHRAVQKMRESVNINIKDKGLSWDEEPSAFEISFEGKQPAKTREVTSAIAKLFIDRNYKLRAEQAAGTTRFLERELARMKEELRQREEAVRQFKEQYAGFLPEQMQNNFNLLTQLQQHLSSINSILQNAEDRKILIQTQLNKLQTMQSARLQAGREDKEPRTLEELRQQLKSLQTRYSDKHPDVVSVKAVIAKLEKEQQTSRLETDFKKANVVRSGSAAQRLSIVQEEDTFTKLKIIDGEIESLRKEKNTASAQIKEYRHRIETGPKIEQMFVDLRRDYERANENYQSLLQKKLEAELAENLERSQKGEQFRIIDPASLPGKPIKPNIKKILAMGYMLAILCGLGLAFLREYLDPSFWCRKEIERALEVPVLVSIPVITTDKERRRNKLKLAATICVLLVMSSTLLYAMYVLWKKSPGLLPIPL